MDWISCLLHSVQIFKIQVKFTYFLLWFNPEMSVWGGFNMLQARDVLFACTYKSEEWASVKSLQAADVVMELVPFTEIRLHLLFLF